MENEEFYTENTTTNPEEETPVVDSGFSEIEG
jgi:hypothetical protein